MKSVISKVDIHNAKPCIAGVHTVKNEALAKAANPNARAQGKVVARTGHRNRRGGFTCRIRQADFAAREGDAKIGAGGRDAGRIIRLRGYRIIGRHVGVKRPERLAWRGIGEKCYRR